MINYTDIYFSEELGLIIAHAIGFGFLFGLFIYVIYWAFNYLFRD